MIDSSYVVAWSHGPGISIGHYDANGNLLFSETVPTPYYNTASAITITALDDGGYTVWWSQVGSTGSTDVTLDLASLRYFADDTRNLGASLLYGGYGAQKGPATTTLNNGDYVLVWQNNYGDGTDIYASLIDANGVGLVGLRVNTTTANDQSAPTITGLSNGGFVVIWQSQGLDGSGFGIYAQRFDANGVAFGVETRINTTTAGDQIAADVAIVERWRLCGDLARPRW